MKRSEIRDRIRKWSDEFRRAEADPGFRFASSGLLLKRLIRKINHPDVFGYADADCFPSRRQHVFAMA